MLATTSIAVTRMNNLFAAVMLFSIYRSLYQNNLIVDDALYIKNAELNSTSEITYILP